MASRTIVENFNGDGPSTTTPALGGAEAFTFTGNFGGGTAHIEQSDGAGGWTRLISGITAARTVAAETTSGRDLRIWIDAESVNTSITVTVIQLADTTTAFNTLSLLIQQLQDEEAPRIDAVHQKIHEGRMFTASLGSLSLADDATLEVLIKPPAGTNPHMRVTAALGGAGSIEIFEGPTVSDDGTELASFNRNRPLQNGVETELFSGPTTSDDGDLLDRVLIPGSTGFFSSIGGSASFFDEIILEGGTVYLVRLTNTSGSAKAAQIELDWYE